MIYRFVSAAILATATFSSASADQCNPLDFKFEEVQKLDVSDAVKHSWYSILDQKKSEKNDTNFSGSAVIYGVPVSLSYTDSKALSEAMLKSSGMSYDRDTRISMIKTALSSTGADMYKNCLGARTASIDVPKSAYTQKSFQLPMTWNPDGRAANKADYEIRLLGGKIEGKTKLQGNLDRGVAKQFQVDKSGNDVLQIDAIINGQKYATIVIPPTAPLKSPTYVKLWGSPTTVKNGVGNVCTDHAYLVAENGSAAGDSTKSCRMCVAQPQAGLLLKSTAKLESILVGAAKQDLETDNPLEICANFLAIGRGKNGPRVEIDDGKLSVWAATIQH